MQTVFYAISILTFLPNRDDANKFTNTIIRAVCTYFIKERNVFIKMCVDEQYTENTEIEFPRKATFSPSSSTWKLNILQPYLTYIFRQFRQSLINILADGEGKLFKNDKPWYIDKRLNNLFNKENILQILLMLLWLIFLYTLWMRE